MSFISTSPTSRVRDALQAYWTAHKRFTDANPDPVRAEREFDACRDAVIEALRSQEERLDAYLARAQESEPDFADVKRFLAVEVSFLSANLPVRTKSASKLAAEGLWEEPRNTGNVWDTEQLVSLLEQNHAARKSLVKSARRAPRGTKKRAKRDDTWLRKYIGLSSIVLNYVAPPYLQTISVTIGTGLIINIIDRGGGD